jgi:hypothetical protein
MALDFPVGKFNCRHRGHDQKINVSKLNLDGMALPLVEAFGLDSDYQKGIANLSVINSETRLSISMADPSGNLAFRTYIFASGRLIKSIAYNSTVHCE